MKELPENASDSMSFFDLQIPFFVPVWRRLVLVTVCALWGSFEFATGALFWGMIFCGMAVFAAWQLFFSGWPKGEA